MITRAEIRRRAKELDVLETHVDRDYVMSHLLARISTAFPELIFRGGTALARVYWPDFRLSEDLDFIAEDAVEDFQARLHPVIDTATESTGRELLIASATLKSGWWQCLITWPEGATKIDINLNERAHLPAPEQQLHMPYSDLETHAWTTKVVAVEEILGNKWFMLDDRFEPRDLFDIWYGLTRMKTTFESLVVGHRAKYGYPPHPIPARAVRRLREGWSVRLEPHMPEVPDFEVVLVTVKGAYQDWAGGTASTGRT